MQIIPALVIKDGKPAAFEPGAKSVRFLNRDPYDLIDTFSKQSIRRIHIVDVDGAQQQGKNNLALIGSLVNVCVSNIEVGGGINDMETLKSLQYAGVDYFMLGSVAYSKPEFLDEILEADHIKNDSITIAVDLVDGQLTYNSYSQQIPEQKVRDVIKRYQDMGFSRVLITDIDTLHPDHGPAIGFFDGIVQAFPDMCISAAGHIDSISDIDHLRDAGVKEVIVGMDLYDTPEALATISAYNDAEEKRMKKAK